MATTEGQSPKKLERKAAAKEEIVNATSGAREIVDHAAFNARAVGKMLLHPFDKDAKADAIAKAREDKTASGQKMAAIRQVGAQQASALRSSARGMESGEAPGSTPATDAAEVDGPSSTPATDAAEVDGPSNTRATEADAPESAAVSDARTATETAAAPAAGDHDRA